MEKKPYTVLIDAKEVAGFRSPGLGKTIALTAIEAEHALRIGHIRPADKLKKDV